MANQPRKDLARSKGQGQAPARQEGIQFQQTVYQGPLPAPQDLFEYDQLLPGTADRIIAMAEREQAHRMNQEDLQMRADIRHRDAVVDGQARMTKGVFISDLFGQAAGALIGVFCVGGAIYLALKPDVSPWIPIALVSLPIASIINAIRQKKEKPPK